MKIEKIEVVSGISKIVYVERKRDQDSNIVTYVASNNVNIDSTSKVQVGEDLLSAAPVIVLRKAPNLVADLFAANRLIIFETAVFLHKDLFVDFLKRVSGVSADRTFLFKMTEDGLSIQDTSKSNAVFLDKESLVAIGLISDKGQWDYKNKAQNWFELDKNVPTCVKPTSSFLSDLGKIPYGGGLLNRDAWDM